MQHSENMPKSLADLGMFNLFGRTSSNMDQDAFRIW